MKRYLLLFILILSVSPIVNALDLKGTFWTDESNAYFFFQDTTVLFEHGGRADKFKYLIKNDSLYLFKNYWIDKDSIKHIQSYGLICGIKSKDSLSLRPYLPVDNEWEKDIIDPVLTDTMKTSRFYNVEKYYDPSLLVFDKLYFMLNEYDYKVEIIIDKNRNYYYHGKGDIKNKGYYQGIISDSLFKVLGNLLEKSCLRLITLEPVCYDIDTTGKVSNIIFVKDGPDYTLNLYVDKEIINLQGNSLPYVAKNLFNFLSKSNRDVKLLKSKSAKKAFGQ